MITATLYIAPYAQQQQIEITDILLEDEAWFVANNAKISCEELATGDIAVYADIGLTEEDGEPLEAIEISFDRTCAQTFTALRKQCEDMLGQ